MVLGLSGKGQARTKGVRAGGPRVQPDQQHTITQDSLKALARTHTKPLSLGNKFTPSAAVATLKDMAKAGRTAEAWKKYRSELRREKEAWREGRIERACADWGLYKTITKPKKQWGELYMATVEAEDPVKQITDHFEQVFHSAQDEQEMEKLEGLIDALGGERQGHWFTQDEVARAIAKGKRGKAVGPRNTHGAPSSTLQDPTTLEAITSFFNEVLASGRVPEHWNRSVTSLLPKVILPTCPKDLRPIALASHVSKAFARLILARLQTVLQVKGCKQFAAKGRQPAAFLWT